MTTQEIEEPLDRLNYFNGQRLEATDLKVEQEYHIRVRRQLNQALYTPGIASGLEVSPSANVHAVTVSPGVALDALGREVILLEPTEVQVRGLPNTEPSWVYGNFLYILYQEEEVAATYGGCTSGKNQLAWGGPTRIRAQPIFAFADAWPNEQDGPIILAQVELDPGCAVAQIHNQVRKYVDAARPTTRTVSYEGEKDLAEDHSKRLSFHVIGGPASSVTLHLWGDEFSSLHYTQLGAHEHLIPATETGVQVFESGDDTDSANFDHTHVVDITGLAVLEEGSEDHGAEHDVKFPANKQDGNLSEKYAIDVSNTADGMRYLSDLNYDTNPGVVTGGKHIHDLSLPHEGLVPSSPPDRALSSGEHHHAIAETKAEATGAGDVISAGPTTRLTYVEDLRVWLDGTDITDQVLAQLGGPANGWDKLGDGTSEHKLHVDQGGTGAIALERIAALNQGEHTLEFKVDNGSGGNLRYNLYVE